MARKAKQSDENLAHRLSINPAKLLKLGISLVGKPVFYLLSNLTILAVLVFYASVSKIEPLFRKKIKSKKTAKKRKKIKSKFRLPKLPVFNLSGIVTELKLDKLKIALFEIKILYNLKRIFIRKLTRFQKIRLRNKLLLFGSALIVISFCTYFYYVIYKPLPPPSDLGKKTPPVSTKIYDRNGVLLYKIYKDENRSIVPLSQIPIHVRLATLAAEDAEFYQNPGFSVKGIIRALIKDINTKSLHGGSTITQQLVKNVLLTPEKTLTRKVKELILAIEVEATYTKDQILEMYLNQVSYGGTAYGIEEASQEYFGKNIKNVTLAEAAYLAGLPKSPTTYSPYGQIPESGISRQKEVLHLMAVNKFITVEQEQEAEIEKLVFLPNKNYILAPHFVMYVRQLLVDKYGEDMVEKGGLEVTTSLDISIQKLAEDIVQDEVTKLKNLNVGNGAAVVLNPKTGEILSMVGSTDYFNSSADGQVNVTTRLRQPGSSIKVVNYTYALGSGKYTPATYIQDSPITYTIPGSQPYSPANYDGRFKGNVTLRSALSQSRNIPAVKILASYGVDKMINLGQEMGISSWSDSSRFGLALTLGGGAVTTLDMARVYSTLANEGKTPELMPILTVKNYKGKTLESNTPHFNQSVDPRVAFLMTNILSDNNARAPEFGFNSYLVIPGHPEVAVKTGTSNDLRDNWTDGYSQDYVVITWVGNNNNAPMSRIASGVTGASPIWNKIMSALLQSKASIDWTVPEGVLKMNCPNGRSEWFLMETVQPNFCSPPTPVPSQLPQNQDQILDGASTRR